jgi:NAD(P)-dependent dehydrogenase (short-subunit alcohol dehydrogenase family)
MKKLEGKVAVVTGASSGLGRAVAILSAEAGAKVICSDIRKSPLSAGFEADIDVDTDELIRNAGGEASFVACDVSKIEQVENLVNSAVEKFGRMDIIFNCAGVFSGFGTIVDKPEKDLDFTLSVNVKGVWNCCQQAIKQFLTQGDGGKIVNIASIASVRGLAMEPDYCTSKGAVVALTKQLAVEYGPQGICVNAICPGAIQTAMGRDVPMEVVEGIIMGTPLRKIGLPEDIAKPAVFLATSDADYITGASLFVDGGVTA